MPPSHSSKSGGRRGLLASITFHLTLQFLFLICPLSPSWDHGSLFQKSTSGNRVDHILDFQNFHRR